MKRLAVAALATLLGAGCVESEMQVCTLIGCQDGATITVRRADGAPPLFDLEVDVDGRKIPCSPAGPAPMFVTCASDLRLMLRERFDCREQMTASGLSLQCTPTGTFELAVQVIGTPRRLGLALRQGATTVASKEFEPSYTVVRPNGPACDPACQQWSATWEGL